jgi:hypothetical protein
MARRPRGGSAGLSDAAEARLSDAAEARLSDAAEARLSDAAEEVRHAVYAATVMHSRTA